MLIIVESPAKAKTISKIVGNKHVVKASVGHIRRISEDKKTADGRKLEINGIDIDQGFTPIYEVDPDKKNVVSELKKLAKAAQDGILFATDSDREGEAISWHLAKVLNIKDLSSVKRLEFHEITQKAIQDAMKNPRDLNLSLVEAQKARQVLDKLVGYKVSPVLWKTMSNYKLSAGRVQSPALRLVCEREKEIINFVPEEFWEIDGLFDKQSKLAQEAWINEENNDELKPKEGLLFKNTWLKGKKTPKIQSKEALVSLTTGLVDNNKFTVISVETSKETSRTKPPFTTSTLQQAASSKIGFSPKTTMQTAQKLYEGVEIDGEPTALITYMRTDSVNLSAESIEAARTFINKNYPDFLPAKPKYYKGKTRNAQEAHEAIRPTDPLRTPESLKGKLSPAQLKLYDLIWRQTVACQMTDEIRERLSFELENSQKDRFSGSTAWTIHAGFKALYPERIMHKEDFEIKQGEQFFLKKVFYSQKFTKPPSRYSAASLIKKLEELGVGRPSTYASIISTLQDRDYVEAGAGSMKPTALGMRVNDLLTENLERVTSSTLTAQMEDSLDEISNGKKQYEGVLEQFWTDFKKEVEGVAEKTVNNKEKYRETLTDVADPKYGDLMVLKMGRFGEYYQNPNHPEVMYPKNFREYEVALKEAEEKFKQQTEGKVCEVCGKPLIVRVSKSKLKPYIACPEYKVGNKHTVVSVDGGKKTGFKRIIRKKSSKKTS